VTLAHQIAPAHNRQAAAALLR